MSVANARSWMRKRWLLSRPLFMLYPTELLPGDVLLSTERAATSFTIRFFTSSLFSHAAIYLGDGLYAEAVGLGVRQRSVATVLKPRIKVVRLSESAVQNARHVATKAASEIVRYVGAGYWSQGALLSIFRKAASTDRHRLFCSHLVASMYSDAGVDVVPGIESNKVTPELLARSKCFDDVTQATVFHTKVIPEHLADHAFETLSDRETVILQTMHAELAPWFEKRGILVPETWDYMVVFLIRHVAGRLQEDLDQELMTSMASSGYFSLLEQAMNEVIKPMERYVDRIKSERLSSKEIIFERIGLSTCNSKMRNSLRSSIRHTRFSL
jgi:uncharacterized protein YycO